MSTYEETEADLPRIIEQIRHLAGTRQHRIARQLAHPEQLTLKAAQSMRSYLNRQPDRHDHPAAASITAQVHRASTAATAAVSPYAKAGGAPASDEPNSLHVENEDDQTPVTRTRYQGDRAADAARIASHQRAPAAERLSGEDDEGYYLHDSRMYKVATSQYGASQGHLFARRLNEQTGDWERAQGMTSYLRRSEKVTLEQAIEFGRQLEVTPQMALYGRCWICKRVLTDEESIRNRVGPGPHIGIDA